MLVIPDTTPIPLRYHSEGIPKELRTNSEGRPKEEYMQPTSYLLHIKPQTPLSFSLSRETKNIMLPANTLIPPSNISPLLERISTNPMRLSSKQVHSSWSPNDMAYAKWHLIPIFTYLPNLWRIFQVVCGKS